MKLKKPLLILTVIVICVGLYWRLSNVHQINELPVDISGSIDKPTVQPSEHLGDEKTQTESHIQKRVDELLSEKKEELPSYKDLLRQEINKDVLEIPDENQAFFLSDLLGQVHSDPDGKIHFTVATLILRCVGVPNTLEKLESQITSISQAFANTNDYGVAQGSGADEMREKWHECNSIRNIIANSEFNTWQDYSNEAANRGNVSAMLSLIEAPHADYDKLSKEELSQHLRKTGKKLLDLRAKCEPRAFEVIAGSGEIGGYKTWEIDSPYDMEVEKYANLLAYMKFYESRIADPQKELKSKYKLLNYYEKKLGQNKDAAKLYGIELYQNNCANI